jgi:peptidoglycan/xylan/chitin deacetylase (PgdA/CDA1 family)
MTVILMYHQVGQVPAENDPYNLALTPEQFDEQMAFLKKHDYRVISLDEAVQKGHSPDKTVVITFDDGFVDLDTTIKPILDTYHFSATVFFVPGCVGQESNWEGQSGQYAAKLLTWERVKALASSGTFHFWQSHDDASTFNPVAHRTSLSRTAGSQTDIGGPARRER